MNQSPFMMPYMMDGFNINSLESYKTYKEMYPFKMRHLSLLVEQEIDRYEYFGSFIYDEYPDKVTVYGIVGRIYNKACEEKCFDEDESPELVKMIIEVMVYNEIWERKSNK